MKPPLRRAAAAAAQEERWRKLQEYLAARGKLKQSSGKPYLKDKTNQQTLVPSKSNPNARCKKTIILNKTKVEQKREAKHAVPASQVPQSRGSRAPVSLKPQNVASELLKKGPLRPLTSKASSENPTGKRSIPASSSKHGLCQVRKTKKMEPATAPKTRARLQTAKSVTYPNHPAERSREKADQENLRSRVDLSLEKKVATRFGLPSGSQTVNSRPGVGFASRGSAPVKRRAQTYQAAKLQVQGNPRGPSTNLKEADLQKPGVSGVQNALKAGQSSTCSRPELKSWGLNPRATKQCTSVLGQGKESAALSRTCRAPDALQRGQLKQQQATPRKAQHVRRHSSNFHASMNPPVTELRGKRTLLLAAHDDIDKSGSTTGRDQSSKKLQRAPRRTPGLKSRPVVSPDRTAKRVVDPRTCERSKSRQLGMRTGQEPQTPCTQDRRKLLEQWRKSQGKSYKRPSMTLPTSKPRKRKQSLNQSFWSSLEEEEERMECSLMDKIASALTECLKLAEEGYPSEEVLAMLSQIPEAEKFAQFWICKAKLLARHGMFDVAELYEAAVRAGAAPLQKLKEVVVDLLKNPDKTAQVIPTQDSPLPARDQVEMTPQSTLRHQICKPVSSIKLQVVPLLRAKEHCTASGTKLLTPVRRSLRIEGASSCYPEMLKDHDMVVTSLSELVATDHGSLFVFRKNEALPEDVEMELLRL